MQNIQLPQEEFDAKALLADISQKISSGRAELAQLHEQKNTFMKERDLELMERLQLLLDNSQEFLKVVDLNHLELQGYANELTAFGVELASWGDKLTQEQTVFIEEKAKFIVQFDQKMAEISQKIGEIKLHNASIERTRQEQYKRTLDLNARETAVNDKYMQLMKTTERLNK